MQDLVPEVVEHLETLALHVGLTAVEALEQTSLAQLQSLMGEQGGLGGCSRGGG